MIRATEVDTGAGRRSVKVRQDIEAGRLNLILAGFPKCGTTSFAHWLSESPVISVSNPKETFLLCSEHHRENAIAAEGSLDRCFPEVDKPLRLEASTRNVYSDILLEEIRSLPHIKIILSFRDPLEAVISWHNQLVQGGEAYDPEIETCWRRSIAECVPLQDEPGPYEDRLRLMQNYASVCEFGYWMEKWQQAIGIERLLLVDASELQGETAPLRGRLNAFCQADLQLPPSPPVLNSYASIRFASFYRKFKHSFLNRRLRDLERSFPKASSIRRTIKEKFFRKSGSKGNHDALKAEMREYFAADIDRSQRLYAQNRQFWEARSATSHSDGQQRTVPNGRYPFTTTHHTTTHPPAAHPGRAAGSQGLSR